jgi:hypothetical protein
MVDEAGKAPQTKDEEQANDGATTSRFPELDELQREIERRIRDNRRFLDGFMNDDFVAEEESGDEPGDEDFEEL